MISRKTKSGLSPVSNRKHITRGASKPAKVHALVHPESGDLHSYAEAVIEAVPPLLVLDQNLRVQTANHSFCAHFQISPGETLNRLVYELSNGQWNIPRLRTLLEEVLPRKKVFEGFEVTHEFGNIGVRT